MTIRSELGPGDRVTCTVTGQIECPFCGGEVTLVSVEGLGPGATHSIPTCPTFDKNDLAEYMRAVRMDVAPRTFS